MSEWRDNCGKLRLPSHFSLPTHAFFSSYYIFHVFSSQIVCFWKGSCVQCCCFISRFWALALFYSANVTAIELLCEPNFAAQTKGEREKISERKPNLHIFISCVSLLFFLTFYSFFWFQELLQSRWDHVFNLKFYSRPSALFRFRFLFQFLCTQ